MKMVRLITGNMIMGITMALVALDAMSRSANIVAQSATKKIAKAR